MSDSTISDAIQPYNLLRSALSLFKKPPKELSSEQYAQVLTQARNELNLEWRVLNAPEATSVIVTEQEIEHAIKAISDRFENEESFLQALTDNNLNPDLLHSALFRQCKVENILESIAAKASNVSEVEVGIYYHMHPEKFHSPEQRTVKHLLITINDDYPENTRINALQRIQELANQLKSKPHKFADLVLKHSECPSALQSGELGTFPRGKLYPEIDAVLFKMKAGQISEVIETEAGFHLILCEKIHSPHTISLKKAQPKILELMQNNSRRSCQRAWIASLPPLTNAPST